VHCGVATPHSREPDRLELGDPNAAATLIRALGCKGLA
jgi:hypothetical protein